MRVDLAERNPGIRRRARAALTAVLACALAAPAFAQEPPRTSWGAPDLQGLWDFRTLTPLERPAAFGDKAVLTPEEAAAIREQTVQALNADQRLPESGLDVEGAYNNFWYDWGSELSEDLRTSLIVDPPNGRLPEPLPEAVEEMRRRGKLRLPPVRDLFSYSADPAEFRPEGPESIGLSERCLVGFNAGPPLMPSAYNNNLRIVQTPDHVLLVTEMIHDARVVTLGDAETLPDGIREWSGTSRGTWDGDTLVVVTENFTDKTPTYQLVDTLLDALTGGGLGSAVNKKLTERFTRSPTGSLIYEYTLEDPTTFPQPFTVRIPMKPSTGKMFEYACHEGNYAMEGMLKGARLLESEAPSNPPSRDR